MNNIKITDELIEKWEPKIHRMLATTSIQGMHKEDLVQELRIVILKAAKKFDSTKKASFHTYLHTAMINTIRTFISQAQKRIHPTTLNTLINYSEYEYMSGKVAKALEDVKLNWKGLGKAAGPISTQVGIPILLMKGMRMQHEGMKGDMETKPKKSIEDML